MGYVQGRHGAGSEEEPGRRRIAMLATVTLAKRVPVTDDFRMTAPSAG